MLAAPHTHRSARWGTDWYLTGWGLPSLRRAITSQLAAMDYPTDESHPWRPHTRPLAQGLKPVTATSRVVIRTISGAGGVSSPQALHRLGRISKPRTCPAFVALSRPKTTISTGVTSPYVWSRVGCRSCRLVQVEPYCRLRYSGSVAPSAKLVRRTEALLLRRSCRWGLHP